MRIHLISPITGEVRPLAESFDRRPSIVGFTPMLATPAISQGVMFFRTRGHLVAVG